MESEGCTAWRVSDDLFATAWHCLPDLQGSCDHASITFDYSPVKGEETNDSTKWGSATESCTKIEYANDRLDFTLFRVSKERWNVWKDTPKLPVLPGSLSYPQTTTATQMTGDRLAIIHHPILAQCSDFDSDSTNISTNEEIAFSRREFQASQMISAFNRTGNSECRAWVRQPGRAGNNPIYRFSTAFNSNINVKYPIGRNHKPEGSFCNRLLPDPAPEIGLLHRCETCPGTSGAPAISLEPAPQEGPARYGTVVGVHSGYYLEETRGHRDYIGNFAIRMSKITECINMDEIREKNQIVFSKSAESKAVCKAQIPQDAPHHVCTSLTESDCIFYFD